VPGGSVFCIRRLWDGMERCTGSIYQVGPLCPRRRPRSRGLQRISFRTGRLYASASVFVAPEWQPTPSPSIHALVLFSLLTYNLLACLKRSLKRRSSGYQLLDEAAFRTPFEAEPGAAVGTRPRLSAISSAGDGAQGLQSSCLEAPRLGRRLLRQACMARPRARRGRGAAEPRRPRPTGRRHRPGAGGWRGASLTALDSTAAGSDPPDLPRRGAQLGGNLARSASREGRGGRLGAARRYPYARGLQPIEAEALHLGEDWPDPLDEPQAQRLLPVGVAQKKDRAMASRAIPALKVASISRERQDPAIRPGEPDRARSRPARAALKARISADSGAHSDSAASARERSQGPPPSGFQQRSFKKSSPACSV